MRFFKDFLILFTVTQGLAEAGDTMSYGVPVQKTIYVRRLSPEGDKGPQGSPPINPDARGWGYGRQLQSEGDKGPQGSSPIKIDARSWGYGRQLQSKGDKGAQGSPPINPDARSWDYGRQQQPEGDKGPQGSSPIKTDARSWEYGRQLQSKGDKGAQGSPPINPDARSWDYGRQQQPEGDKGPQGSTPINPSARSYRRQLQPEGGKGPRGSPSIIPYARSQNNRSGPKPEGDKVAEGSPSVNLNAYSRGKKCELPPEEDDVSEESPPVKPDTRSWSYRCGPLQKEDKVPERSAPIKPSARGWGYGTEEKSDDPLENPNIYSVSAGVPIRSLESDLKHKDNVPEGAAPINPSVRGWSYRDEEKSDDSLENSNIYPVPAGVPMRSLALDQKHKDNVPEESAPINPSARGWGYGDEEKSDDSLENSNIYPVPAGVPMRSLASDQKQKDNVPEGSAPINPSARGWGYGDEEKSDDPLENPHIYPLLAGVPLRSLASDQKHKDNVPEGSAPINPSARGWGYGDEEKSDDPLEKPHIYPLLAGVPMRSLAANRNLDPPAQAWEWNKLNIPVIIDIGYVPIYTASTGQYSSSSTQKGYKKKKKKSAAQCSQGISDDTPPQVFNFA